MEDTVEVLIVLPEDAAHRGEAELVELGWTIASRLPPRILVLRGTTTAAHRTEHALPGVSVVHEGDADMPSGLSDSERLFVSAWLVRLAPKVRPGDGAHWDAPGFSPPDNPPHA